MGGWLKQALLWVSTTFKASSQTKLLYSLAVAAGILSLPGLTDWQKALGLICALGLFTIPHGFAEGMSGKYAP